MCSHLSGQANLYINDRLVVSNAENQVLGDIWFGTGTIEEKGEIELTAGKTYNMRLEWSNFKPVNPNGVSSLEPLTRKRTCILTW